MPHWVFAPSRSGQTTRLLGALLSLLVIAGSGCSNRRELQVVPIDGDFDGHTYSELGAAWWQWAASLPVGQHPLVPDSKAGCEAGQQGSIWFLGGAFSSAPSLQYDLSRGCSVPRGTALFFPIINYAITSVPDGKDSEAVLRKKVNDTLAPVKDLYAELDKIPVDDLRSYRENSVPFPINAVADGIFLPGPHKLAVDGGFYLLVEPPSPGKHTISFRGSVPLSPSELFTLNVRYSIYVE